MREKSTKKHFKKGDAFFSGSPEGGKVTFYGVILSLIYQAPHKSCVTQNLNRKINTRKNPWCVIHYTRVETRCRRDLHQHIQLDLIYFFLYVKSWHVIKITNKKSMIRWSRQRVTYSRPAERPARAGTKGGARAFFSRLGENNNRMHIEKKEKGVFLHLYHPQIHFVDYCGRLCHTNFSGGRICSIQFNQRVRHQPLFPLPRCWWVLMPDSLEWKKATLCRVRLYI